MNWGESYWTRDDYYRFYSYSFIALVSFIGSITTNYIGLKVYKSVKLARINDVRIR